MRRPNAITFVGTGDAFNSCGRAHTCFRVDSGGRTLVVDFGASALAAWRKSGLNLCDIDSIVLSHLHGDHFVVFLPAPRLPVCLRFRAPLVIAGPPGTAARLNAAMEVFFPNSTRNKWRFDWSVVEIAVGQRATLAGFEINTTEMQHHSGAPSTALRVARNGKLFAYSGDTAWTDSLIDVADSADLFVIECSSADAAIPTISTGRRSKPICRVSRQSVWP